MRSRDGRCSCVKGPVMATVAALRRGAVLCPREDVSYLEVLEVQRGETFDRRFGYVSARRPRCRLRFKCIAGCTWLSDLRAEASFVRRLLAVWLTSGSGQAAGTSKRKKRRVIMLCYVLYLHCKRLQRFVLILKSSDRSVVVMIVGGYVL